MASEFELMGDAKAGAVIGTTTHSGTDVSMYGQMKRTQYIALAAGSTTVLSTAAYIDRIIINPATTASGGWTLSDGTTAILAASSLGHQLTPRPYTVYLGIRNTAAAGFKLVLGASVSAIVVGGFVGAATTA
jgi:hypothetical protein